jgi:hypothetical protein
LAVFDFLVRADFSNARRTGGFVLVSDRARTDDRASAEFTRSRCMGD